MNSILGILATVLVVINFGECYNIKTLSKLEKTAVKSKLAKRNAVSDPNLLWPAGVVYYVIDDSLSDDFKNSVMEAMQMYEDSTCITFKARKDEKDYIKIFKGEGCYSNVGRTGGEQDLSLGNGCGDIGTILHTLGHSIGFYSEQNRSDRDDYLIIHEENVVPGFEFELEKLPPQDNQLLIDFDYDSIMLNGNYYLSKDGKSMTIEAKNGQLLPEVYEKSSLSTGDKENVNLLYKC